MGLSAGWIQKLEGSGTEQTGTRTATTIIMKFIADVF
jgi:hypothetical protein